MFQIYQQKQTLTDIVTKKTLLNTLVSGRNREFSCQNNRIARGFVCEFLRSGKRYRPGQRLKRHGKSSCLHSNNFLLGGCDFFVSDVISGELLGHLGPLYLALGANRYMVQSESFDRL